MELADFVRLPPPEVAAMVSERHACPLGVAIPFNGTRRWYMATFHKSADELYTGVYLVQVFRRMLAVMEMMFADGAHTIYTPVIGRDLAERGETYMQFGAQAVAQVASSEAVAWYRAHGVEALCYGETGLLPPGVQTALAALRPDAASPRRLRYGVFADQPLPDIIARAVRLYQAAGAAPAADQVLTDYYGGVVAPVGMWIGSDQPTVFDVPLVIHGNTALYFLQFPTLYLDPPSWRRLLYDYLFVRGDQETLYPANVAAEKHITGLGRRQDGYWVPCTT